jgi:hypothetical protein
MNPHIKTRHRVVRVGNLLVEGPFSIRPPQEVDEYGWLECDLRLTQSVAGVVTSVAVYVDDSMNREEDFLPPVLRHTTWERAEDIRRALAGEISWPTATVRLSHVGNAQAEVDRVMRDVQARLGSAPFVVTGLVTNRAVPNAEPDPRGEIQVFARNGIQRVEVATRAAEDGGLHSAAVDAIASLTKLIEPISLEGWRETYSQDLRSEALSGLHYWDYRRPGDNAPAA